jgi:hypothetical protein
MPKFKVEAKKSSKKMTPKGGMMKDMSKMSKGSGSTRKKGY